MDDIVLLLLRLVLGVFFVLARFRWFYDPSNATAAKRMTGRAHWFPTWRHRHLEWKLCSCGYSRHPVLSGAVACVEVSAGCALVLGLLTQPAAFGLLVILLFATWCTARAKVMEQEPVDRIDVVSCYLWRVEGVYITIAVCILLAGGGRFALDSWVWQYVLAAH